MGVASAYESGVVGNLRHIGGALGRDALAVGQIGHRGNSRRGGIAGIAEQVLDGAALHRGIGTPRPLGILVALEIAVIPRIGVDDDACRPVLLRNKRLHPAKVFSVADDDDLALHVNAHLLQLLEVLKTAIVGVNHLGGNVARRREFVEGRQNARVVLEGIVADTLGRWADHGDTLGRNHLDLDVER